MSVKGHLQNGDSGRLAQRYETGHNITNCKSAADVTAKVYVSVFTRTKSRLSFFGMAEADWTLFPRGTNSESHVSPARMCTSSIYTPVAQYIAISFHVNVNSLKIQLRT